MSNKTVQDPNTGWDQFGLYIIYIIQGAILSSCNLFAVIAILRQQALRIRKEYIIIGGKIFADGLLGLAYFIGGCYFALLVLWGHHGYTVNVEYCLTMPNQVLFAMAAPIYNLMEMVQSIDRLFAISMPLLYYKTKRGYSLLMVGVVVALNVFIGVPTPILVTTIVGPVKPTVNIKCRPAAVQASVHPLLGMWYIDLNLGAHALALLNYIPILVFYQKNQPTGTTSQIQQQQKRQRRLTKSLMISALCTVVMFLIPAQLGFFFIRNGRGLLATICFVISNFDLLLNLIILMKRQPEIRKAMRALLHCQQLPPNLKSWHVGPVSGATMSKAPQARRNINSKNDDMVMVG